MSRGFVAIWYSGYGVHRPNPNSSTADFWKTMVAGTLRAWRAHHPNDRLVFLDLDNQFCVPEHEHLRALGIEDGRLRYPTMTFAARPFPWTRTFLDKALVLEYSPFDETCLFDLDFLFLGNISRIFDLVDRVGLLGYPFYQRTRNRINSGLWVVKDRSIWPAFWSAVEHIKAIRPFDDEHALDLCIDRGAFPVTKLSPTYGMDPFCWLMRDGMRRRGRGWCDVEELRPPDPLFFEPQGVAVMSNMWTMGPQLIRAIHMSGAKERIVNSELWHRYMCAVTFVLAKRYGGQFPACCE